MFPVAHPEAAMRNEFFVCLYVCLFVLIVSIDKHQCAIIEQKDLHTQIII